MYLRYPFVAPLKATWINNSGDKDSGVGFNVETRLDGNVAAFNYTASRFPTCNAANDALT